MDSDANACGKNEHSIQSKDQKRTLVERYSGHFLASAYWKHECAKPSIDCDGNRGKQKRDIPG